MSPRSAPGWPEREEKNLLPWMSAYRALPIESLRWKKYHILRKQRRIGAKSPEHPGKQKRPGAVRRSVAGIASLSTLPTKTPAQRNIDKWFQTILAADPSQPDDSNEPTQTKRISSGRVTPAPILYRPRRTRSSSWMWDYVHRVCAARKPRYR
ncbi:hypothetical protein AAEP93_010575 [Penicillium crustosum]